MSLWLGEVGYGGIVGESGSKILKLDLHVTIDVSTRI
jgi:hypothetical protein